MFTQVFRVVLGDSERNERNSWTGSLKPAEGNRQESLTQWLLLVAEGRWASKWLFHTFCLKICSCHWWRWTPGQKTSGISFGRVLVLSQVSPSWIFPFFLLFLLKLMLDFSLLWFPPQPCEISDKGPYLTRASTSLTLPIHLALLGCCSSDVAVTVQL